MSHTGCNLIGYLQSRCSVLRTIDHRSTQTSCYGYLFSRPPSTVRINFATLKSTSKLHPRPRSSNEQTSCNRLIAGSRLRVKNLLLRCSLKRGVSPGRLSRLTGRHERGHRDSSIPFSRLCAQGWRSRAILKHVMVKTNQWRPTSELKVTSSSTLPLVCYKQSRNKIN